MTNTEQVKEKEEFGFRSLLIVVLSIYVLLVLALKTFIDFNPEVDQILDYMDNAICVVFLHDFLLRFYRAENKWKFMRWGWFDLVSSIPNISIFRAGRAYSVIRIFRVLRAFRSVRHITLHLFKNRAQGTLAMVVTISFLMIIFSSIAILQVEDSPESNIRTAEDAIWWSYETITTIFYGELFPVTMEGRFISAILMLTGMALFGTFTSYLASWFIEERQSRKE
jgi:voltage-gated potassium channel